MKTTNVLLSIFIAMPIRFYLMWYILTSINATELPMFLFWASIPIAIVLIIITESLKGESDEKKVIKSKSTFNEKLEA